MSGSTFRSYVLWFMLSFMGSHLSKDTELCLANAVVALAESAK
jgi:hypothetical protein